MFVCTKPLHYRGFVKLPLQGLHRHTYTHMHISVLLLLKLSCYWYVLGNNYECIHPWIFGYTHTFIQIYTHICIDIHACLPIYKHLYMHSIYMYVSIHIDSWMCMHALTHAHIHTWIHTCIETHAFLIQIFIFAYKQTYIKAIHFSLETYIILDLSICTIFRFAYLQYFQNSILLEIW